MNYTQTLEYIHSLGNFKLPAGLERIAEVLKKLGDPQEKFDAVHIAGTNGKGSVSAMLAKIFETAGFKTGLYISPYIIDFRERIQINGNFIPEEKMTEYAERVKNTGVAMSEFEFITAAAFSYFADEKCDIVIAETGLGGRLDATNTLMRVKAAVITKIGLDHIGILGDTLEKIAEEKCGIIKDFVTVSSPCQKPEALAVIEKYADRLFVPDTDRLQIIKSDFSGNSFIYDGYRYDLSLLGNYQIENALTVIETVKHSGYDIPYGTVKKALANTFFPARNEVICKKPLIVLDGAHNPDSAEALSAVMEKYSGRITAIIGVMRDKDYEAVLAETLKHCCDAVAVTVKDMPRSLDKGSLADAAGVFCPCFTADSYADAVKKAISVSGGEPIFVFGSLYLASGIRDLLLETAKKFNSDAIF